MKPRRGSRFSGAALGVLLATTRVTAQTLPLPALPPEPPPQPEPTLSAGGPQGAPPAAAETVDAAAPSPPRAWEYALGAGVAWDDNFDFLVRDGPRGVAVLPRGGVARVLSRPRAQLRATAAGYWAGYADQDEPSRHYADFGLVGSYRPSPTTSWRAHASYGFGDSHSSRILRDQGVLLPAMQARSLVGALGVSRKYRVRQTLRIDARFYRTGFDSPGLIDGESIRGTVGLERHFSRQSTGTLEYSVEDVLSDQQGRSYLTQFASLQWTHVLSRRTALLLEGGASYTPDASRAGLYRKESFFGGASFNRQARRSSVALFIRREVVPAFGLGLSRLETRAGLSASIRMAREWELRMVLLRVQPESPQGTAQAYGPSDDAMAALSRRLGRQMQVSAEARYRGRGATSTDPSVSGFRAGVFLTLLTPSGTAIVPPPGL